MAKKQGQTPGPWKWYWKEHDGEANCGVIHEPRTGHAYSVCRCPRYQVKEKWEADARLIAAAPDLLEACKIILDGYDNPESDEYFDWPDAAEKLRAAIDKAEGRNNG